MGAPLPQPAPKTVELLAPAGGVEAGLAAIQYGADAIYLGLERFSARADADNFTLEQLDSFVGFAHAQVPRRRVFAAVNTLVLQSELGDVAEALGALADIGVDAVIVQDLGVVRLARRHFPELELHASTQLAVHDRKGVEAMARLGFRRVTLARELELEEIRACAGVPGTEVETFLHGALCYSYSGLCLFSSHLLGRSGNRGRCAYPCRDRWTAGKLEERPAGPGMPDLARSGFAFSMKDLAAGDQLSALRDAGVACLKIEGRKKSPLYVATAVDFYRRMLDGALPPSERPAREADLKAVFSRPWTSLYLRSHLDKDVADRDFVGHRGTRVGAVESVVRAGRVASVRFTTSRDLEKHDGLQIDVPGLDRPFGFAVSELRILPAPRRERAGPAVEAPAGSRVEVPLPEDAPRIPDGAPVYCSSSQEVKQRFRVESQNLRAHRSRLALRIRASVDAGHVRARASVPERAVEVEQEIAGTFDRAKDAAKMEGAARGAFEKLGDTRFRLSDFEWSNPGGLFAPVSKLNELRRQVLEALEARVSAGAQARVSAAREECMAPAGVRAREGGASASWSIKADRFEAFSGIRSEDWSRVEEIVFDVSREPLAGMVEKVRELSERSRRPVRLALPMICRAWDEKSLELKISRLRAAGFARWEAANASAFRRLEPLDGLDLSAGWPVYVMNRLAAEQLRELGARNVVLSPEDGIGNLRQLLAELGDRATVVVYQDTPLFLSESCPYANLLGRCPGTARCRFDTLELTSAYGSKVLAINDRCRTYVVNEVPFCLGDRLDALRAAGATRFRADFIHRRYGAAEAAEIFRRLRDGEPVRGHRANYDRGLASDAR